VYVQLPGIAADIKKVLHLAAPACRRMHFIKPTLVLQRDGQYRMPAVETAECNVVAMGTGVDLAP
jgi:hypothetical protein